jgi:uncharacterized protein YcgI (DUF1989 family)
MEGPDHYWIPAGTIWKTACGAHVLDSMDVFSGIRMIYLTFENNPLKQSLCEFCKSMYLETDYGGRHGIVAPAIRK